MTEKKDIKCKNNIHNYCTCACHRSKNKIDRPVSCCGYTKKCPDCGIMTYKKIGFSFNL